MTKSGLAEKLAPKLRAALEMREKELVAAAHPWFIRQAIGLAFPTFLNQIPSLTRMALDFVITEFGAMNVNDLLAFLETHVKQEQGWRFRSERNPSSGPNGEQPGVAGGPAHTPGSAS